MVAEQLQISVCTRAPHLADEVHLRAVAEHMAVVGPLLVVLDPLYLAAGGADVGKDLYAMGRLLERPQHLCERPGAALFVVTHFNPSRGLRGAARITGAGPAEWGRVLISAGVVSRRTDPVSQESTVLVELDVQGGEVPDQTVRVRRTVRAENPDELDSALLYRTDEPRGLPEGSAGSDLAPAPAKVLEALTVLGPGGHRQQQIGDVIAEQFGSFPRRMTGSLHVVISSAHSRAAMRMGGRLHLGTAYGLCPAQRFPPAAAPNRRCRYG